MAGLANWGFDAWRAWCGVEGDAAWVAGWAMAKGGNAATARARAQQAWIEDGQELVDEHGNSIVTIRAQALLDFKAEFLHGMI